MKVYVPDYKPITVILETQRDCRALTWALNAALFPESADAKIPTLTENRKVLSSLLGTLKRYKGRTA